MSELSPIEKHDLALQEHAGRNSLFLANIAGAGSVLFTIILCTVITEFSHFTFGFFRVVFGVFAGILVKHIGKGSGTRYGVLAGVYAVIAVIGYEVILSTFYIVGRDPSTAPGLEEEEKEFFRIANNFGMLVQDFATAAVAFVIAYRIGKNPMKKDELDYLLEAKLRTDDDEKYAKNYFKRKRRR